MERDEYVNPFERARRAAERAKQSSDNEQTPASDAPLYRNRFEAARATKHFFTASRLDRDTMKTVAFSGRIEPIGDYWHTVDVEPNAIAKTLGIALRDVSGRSYFEVVDKLKAAGYSVSLTTETPPSAFEQEAQKIKSERAAEREAAKNPAPPKPTVLGGLDPDGEEFKQVLAQAVGIWVAQHQNDPELADVTGTPGEVARANRLAQENGVSLHRLLRERLVCGDFAILTAREVEQCYQWLRANGFWLAMRRKFGQSAGQRYPEGEFSRRNPPAAEVEAKQQHEEQAAAVAAEAAEVQRRQKMPLDELKKLIEAEREAKKRGGK